MSIQRFPAVNNNSGSSGGLQGTWNASTNTPALANTDTGKLSYMYQVSTGGTVDFGSGNIVFEAKDIVVNNGTVWDKIDGSDSVISVNGNNGVVVLDADDIGLGNVDNTSDVNKPISNATSSALSGKASTSHNHNASDINAGTLNASRLPTAIDATKIANGSVSNTEFQYLDGVTSAIQTQIDGKVATDGAKVLTDVNFTSAKDTKLSGIATGAQVNTVTSVASKTGAVTLAKADVGLGNVDNTSDANKPVSTAQQTALNLKANLASPTFTGTVNGITKSMVGLPNVPNTDATNASNINSGTLNASRIPTTFMKIYGFLSRMIGEDGFPPPTITANTTGTYVDYTVSGAGVGRQVKCNVRSPGVSNLIAIGECTGTDTVRVYFCTTSGSVDIEEKSIDIMVYANNA